MIFDEEGGHIKVVRNRPPSGPSAVVKAIMEYGDMAIDLEKRSKINKAVKKQMAKQTIMMGPLAEFYRGVDRRYFDEDERVIK
jgi:hypothetical protein